jgi:inactivated superfamily I helicase
VAVRLAPVSPRAAILEAWRGVESAILEAAHSLGKPFFDDRSPVLVSAIRALEESGQLLRAQADILDDLRQLRNEAAHAPEFSIPVSDALDYVRLSEVAASHLRGIAAEAPRR